MSGRGFFGSIADLFSGRAPSHPCGPPEAFRDRFIAKLLEAYPGAVAEAEGPLDVRIRLPGDDEEHFRHLGHFYRECGRNPDLLDPMLDRLVAASATNLDAILAATPLEMRRARLVPAIRPPLASESTDEANPLIMRPFATGLFEVLAEKPPNLLAFISRDRVGEYGMTEAQLWTQARANIATVITGVKVESLGPGVHWVTAQSEDAPSLVLDDGFWRDRITAETGDPVVFFCHREHFMYAESARPGALELLDRMVEGDDGAALSLRLYRRSADGGWTAE